MARLARTVVAGLPDHVTQRGNRREAMFFEDGDQETGVHSRPLVSPDFCVPLTLIAVFPARRIAKGMFRLRAPGFALTPGGDLLYKCAFLKGGKPYAHVAKGIDSRGSWQCRR
jgi:hypothetical protein